MLRPEERSTQIAAAMSGKGILVSNGNKMQQELKSFR